MNKKTAWMYTYGVNIQYIGCRAQEGIADCIHKSLEQVDCPNCKHNITIEEYYKRKKKRPLTRYSGPPKYRYKK
jgi:hypothetical protein